MSRNTWIALVAAAVLIPLSGFLINSESEGVGGLVADGLFYAWILVVVAIIALGVRAIAQRFRSNGAH